MKLISYCNRIIEYSFYGLFLLVPLVFSGATSELFEFPKMWLTFGLTIFIVTAWICKMILERSIRIQRTPLDIPILLFLTSQIISTIFSIDRHISLWGYYSRFNGGLLSMISYIFLYYALVSNLDLKHLKKLLYFGLAGAFIVALWGLPSHFGADPTCFVFRGNFDTSCWTDAFKPTIRIFSTLGQPAWMAAYMSIFIPLIIYYFLKNVKQNKAKSAIFFLIALLFYADLTYTDTRGGFLGFWIANIIFWGIIFFKKLLKENFLKYFLILNLTFLAFNFLAGIPISQLSKFTLPELTKNSTTSKTQPKVQATGELGGTDSGKIRLLVWRGAIDAWKDHPLFGTGVETFAFTYYKYKPVAHNLTSEWDYLYNKAHNEYLNYLATTGIFGLGSYLAIIGTFLFISIRKLKVKSEELKVAVESSKSEKLLSLDSNFALCTLHFALLASYISILISNFFGFSVVIINIYFFLIPAFVFILSGILNPDKKIEFPSVPSVPSRTSFLQWGLIIVLILISFSLNISLLNYWNADTTYALGSNLNKAGSYQEAYKPLELAVQAKPNEPVYTDEFSVNLATLATGLYLQKDASGGAQLAKEAIDLSTHTVTTHPNNIVFWKNRVRLFYTLSQGDPAHKDTYLKGALIAITKAEDLAPNDAKISYNLGVLLGQTGDTKKAIGVLEKTVQLKPDYRDAYFALGLFYHEQAINKNGTVTDPVLQKKAIKAHEYILQKIDPQDKQVKDTLKSWR